MTERKDVAYDLNHWAKIADRMAASQYAQNHGNMQFGVTHGNNSYIVVPLDCIAGPVLYSTADKPATMQCFAVHGGMNHG